MAGDSKVARAFRRAGKRGGMAGRSDMSMSRIRRRVEFGKVVPPTKQMLDFIKEAMAIAKQSTKE